MFTSNFNSNNPHNYMSNNEALRAIIHATEGNPNGIRILVNTNPEDDATQDAYHGTNATIDVVLHGKGYQTYVFKLRTCLEYKEVEIAEGKVDKKCNITVQYNTKDGLGYPIELRTIDEFGRTYKENEVDLSTDDIQPEITRVFEILNQRAQKDERNPHSISVFFDYIPF